jgi:hypothetical protein
MPVLRLLTGRKLSLLPADVKCKVTLKEREETLPLTRSSSAVMPYQVSSGWYGRGSPHYLPERAAHVRSTTHLPMVRTANSVTAPVLRQLVWAPDHGVRHRSILGKELDLETLQENLHHTLGQLWGESTWRARTRTWTQFAEFLEVCTECGLMTPTDADIAGLAALFVQYRREADTSASTLLGSVSHLKAMIKRTYPNASLGILEDLSKVLRKAAVLTLQALPITLQEFRFWVRSLPPRERLPAVLAFITSSRWDDMVNLLRSDVYVTPVGWLITFRSTKSMDEADYRPDQYVPLLNPPLWMQRALAQYLPDEPLTNMTTDAVRKSLERVQPLPSTIANFPSCRQHFTAHSLKRGANTLLWQGLVAEGTACTYTPALIAMLAKHKIAWEVPTVTVAYAADRMALARALGLDRPVSWF